MSLAAISSAPLLLASLLGANAQLEVDVRPDGLVEARLCLSGDGQQVRYQLSSQNGGARSSQSGTLTLAPQRSCPVISRTSRQADTRYRLRWWVDGVEQEPIERGL